MYPALSSGSPTVALDRHRARLRIDGGDRAARLHGGGRADRARCAFDGDRAGRGERG